MTVDVAILISLISAAFAIFFGIMNIKRNAKNDTESSAEEKATVNAMVMTKLDRISEDIKDMRRDFKDTQKEVQCLHDRVVILEEGMKRMVKE